MTRYGDYLVMCSATLNASALLAYAWQGHWLNVLYWTGALCINLSLIWMR